MAHFCAAAAAAGPQASLDGHPTYLYPFLSLLAGWFGMVRLQPLRVVPRRGIRDVSTCCGASHLRAEPFNEDQRVCRTVICDETRGGAPPSPLCRSVIPPPRFSTVSRSATPRAVGALRGPLVLPPLRVLLRLWHAGWREEKGSRDPDAATRTEALKITILERRRTARGCRAIWET